jgi:hypothetical protein
VILDDSEQMKPSITRPLVAASLLERKQESSVRHLQQLYTIVAGLALSDAVSTLFRGEVAPGSDWPVLCLIAAFVVTLIPFFHGAMRHLDDTYLLSESNGQQRNRLLAADFVILFVESVLLFMLAHWILDPQKFLFAAIALLAVDIAWAIVSHLLGDREEMTRQPGNVLQRMRHGEFVLLGWAGTNLVFIAVLLIYWAYRQWLGETQSNAMAISLLCILSLRSIVDYAISWHFYFPSASATHAGS